MVGNSLMRKTFRGRIPKFLSNLGVEFHTPKKIKNFLSDRGRAKFPGVSTLEDDTGFIGPKRVPHMKEKLNSVVSKASISI